MATVKAFLDVRKSGGDNTKAASLKLAIAHRKSTAYILLNVNLLPTQWDAQMREVVGHPEKKTLNTFIRRKVSEAEVMLARIAEEVDVNSLSATELRGRIADMTMPAKAAPKPEKKEDDTTFIKVYERCMATKGASNARLFRTTLNRIKAFVPAEELETLRFEAINVEWLLRFEKFLALTCPSANGRSIHLRNLRTVVNFAIDMEITSNYPFRRFRIKQEKTRKRNFDVDTLRRIFSHQCQEEWQQKYLDFFKLSFMLIGINVVDLCNLQGMKHGYACYKRAKTHKEYSVKVEKEAQELIDKYRGSKQLLNYLDSYKNYRHFYNNLTKGLRAVKEQLDIDELTSYWARHTWATIAASLDIPKDTIAAALGHGNNTVTDIYIEFDMTKVDQANRKVLDWVLYGVRG